MPVWLLSFHSPAVPWYVGPRVNDAVPFVLVCSPVKVEFEMYGGFVPLDVVRAPEPPSPEV